MKKVVSSVLLLSVSLLVGCGTAGLPAAYAPFQGTWTLCHWNQKSTYVISNTSAQYTAVLFDDEACTVNGRVLANGPATYQLEPGTNGALTFRDTPTSSGVTTLTVSGTALTELVPAGGIRTFQLQR